ncbi:MAG: hypothetical protein KC457_32665 [Myxococcales bacterium]|nr:hypothetical protein [Myxococcales bacterium]
MRWMAVLGVSAALGLLAAASDVRAGGLDQTGFDRAVSSLLNAGWLWAGLAVFAGWVLAGRYRWPVSTAGGFVALETAVAGYYAYGVLAGDRAGSGLAGISAAARLWAVSAVVLGVLLGAVGHHARRSDLLGSVARAVVPVGALAEVLVVRRLDADAFAVDPWLAWSGATVVVLAVVCLAAISIGALRTGRTGHVGP